MGMPRARYWVAKAARSSLLVMMLASCSGTGEDLPPIPDADASIYHLGPGDQIRLLTYGDQSLSGQFRLDAGGNITVPLVGTLHAAGMTPQILQTTVEARLKQLGLYNKPSVSVEVLQYRPIFVLGEVAKPGQYPYQPGMTVLTAVAVAGGFTYRAVESRFSIVRAAQGHKMEGLAMRQTVVQPGDVIDVFERTF